MHDGVRDPRRCRQFAEQSRAEHDAGEDLAHDLRLAKSGEKIAQQLGQRNKQ